MLLSRRDIKKRIQKRLGGKVSKLLIDDAIVSIREVMTRNLLKGNNIPIDNFGIFSIFVHDFQSGRNIHDGSLHEPEKITLVKFRVHRGFTKLLLSKRKKFRKRA